MSPPQLDDEEVESLMSETRGPSIRPPKNTTNNKQSSSTSSVRSCWLVALGAIGALIMVALFTDVIELNFNRNTADIQDKDPLSGGNSTAADIAAANHAKPKASPKPTKKEKNKKNKGSAAAAAVVHTPPVQEPGFKTRPSKYSDTYLPRAQPLLPQADVAAVKQALADKHGSWTLTDPKASKRPQHDFYSPYPNRDVPRADFPKTAWQTDTSYLKDFLPEAKALVQRSMEAILAEYGHSPEKEPDKSFDERAAMFDIALINITAYSPPKRNQEAFTSGGWSNTKSMNGLEKRLLHAIMTEDTFTVVQGGHSAAAGHGNHFVQSYTMIIQKTLEPVFARLGVTMTAHNMGMGGLGTVQNSIGAKDLYGSDMDYVLWDSSMTEKSVTFQDLFARQSLMAGDRVPVVTGMHGQILKFFHETFDADVIMGATGGQHAGKLGIEETTDMATADTIPWAARYIKCIPELNQDCKTKRFDSHCWIDRPDVTPNTTQNAQVGGQASWHPGHKFHLLSGRLLSFPILKALHAAIATWEQAPNYELPDDAWHMDAYYRNIRSKVLNVNRTLGTCRGINNNMIPERVCWTSMHARSEYLPRRNPDETSIRSLLKFPEQIEAPAPNLYDPPDVRNPSLEVPEGAVDYLNIVENGSDFVPNRKRIIAATDSRRLSSQTTSRELANPDIKPGKGWMLDTHSAPDLCDGSYSSFCGKERAANCLLSGHNDHRGGIYCDSYSGWLILEIPKVQQGLIMLRVEDWQHSNANQRTAGWTCENNECDPTRRLGSSLTSQTPSAVDTIYGSSAGTNSSEADDLMFRPGTSSRRRLKKQPPPPYCDEFIFEFAIDGKITAWDGGTYKNLTNIIYPLLDDPNFSGGQPKNVEVALRQTGCGRSKPLHLTHVYWA